MCEAEGECVRVGPVMRRMFEKRLRGYRAIGYDREEQNGLTLRV